jgi:hypothetical protein
MEWHGYVKEVHELFQGLDGLRMLIRWLMTLAG